MIQEYGVGAFGVGDWVLPDEDCLITGKGPEQTILNFSSIIAAFTSPDRRLEIRDIQLMGIGAAQGLVRATFGVTASWQQPQVAISNVTCMGWLELGECWLPTLTRVQLSGRAYGIRTIGRVMGLGTRQTQIFPVGATSVGVLIDREGCEGADLDINIVGGRDGILISCPTARPGWKVRGHTDTERFGVQLVNAAQADIDILGYRRGIGAHNTVNAVGACDFVRVRGMYINTGGKDSASAVVIGSGVLHAKVLGMHASGFEKGLWIQGGAYRTQYDHLSMHDCTAAVVDNGTGTIAGTVSVT